MGENFLCSAKSSAGMIEKVKGHIPPHRRKLVRREEPDGTTWVFKVVKEMECLEAAMNGCGNSRRDLGQSWSTVENSDNAKASWITVSSPCRA